MEKEIENYFKLKSKYDTKYNNLKKKIIGNDDLSNKQKKQKIKNIKLQCINCGKPGGTLFKREGQFLYAVCNASPPCNLNLKIDRGNYMNIRNEYDNILQEVKNIRSEIIQIKLDLLFEYNDESKTIKLFDSLKKQLILFSKTLLEIKKKNSIHNRQSS